MARHQCHRGPLATSAWAVCKPHAPSCVQLQQREKVSI